MLKILDLSPYWTSPPRGGGQLRTHNINRCLAAHCDITQWSFRPTLNDLRGHWKFRRSLQVLPTYREVQVLSPLALGTAFAVDRARVNPDIWQGAMLNAVPRSALKRAIRSADVIQVEHPWLFRYAERRRIEGTPIVLNSHNLERFLLEGRPDPPAQWAIRQVGAIERHAVEHADGVLACSPEDRDILGRMRGKDDVVLAPNGVDVARFTPVGIDVQAAAKKQLGLEGRFVALFAGGVHYPNRDAAEFLRQLAQLLEPAGVTVLVVGRASSQERAVPGFVATGFVDDVMPFFRAADIALNPLNAGSGSSLKMLEFLSMGLPTITTAVGARGTRIQDGRHALLRDRAGFAEAIFQLQHDEALRALLRAEGRKFAVERFSWEGVARDILQLYEDLVRG